VTRERTWSDMRANRRWAAAFSGRIVAVNSVMPRALAASASSCPMAVPRPLPWRGARGVAHPAPDADELVGVVGEDGDDRVMVDVVDLGQVAQLGEREVVLGREEAQPRALGREPPHAALEHALVARPNRAQHDLGAVAEGQMHGLATYDVLGRP
jgi:hypothetical protein